MFKLGRSILFVFVAVAGSADARAEVSSSELKIMVRTYNYAAVTREILGPAEQGAAGIFHRASIELVWINCPVSQREIEKFPACTQITNDPRAVTLKILSESMAVGYGLPANHLGSTIQQHASFIFCHRVRELAKNSGLSEQVVLGQVIAHELGHLLLGVGAHSDTGIMMDDLRVNNFRQAEKGRPLTFNQEQALLMRVRLQEKMTGKK